MQNGQVGSRKRGGFFGMLASLGIPLAIELVKNVLGKGLHVEGKGKRGKGLHVEGRGKRGKGLRLEPLQPFCGSWNTSSRPYRKKKL